MGMWRSEVSPGAVPQELATAIFGDMVPHWDLGFANQVKMAMPGGGDARL